MAKVGAKKTQPNLKLRIGDKFGGGERDVDADDDGGVERRQ